MRYVFLLIAFTLIQAFIIQYFSVDDDFDVAFRKSCIANLLYVIIGFTIIYW
jgi:hypothetical protein